MGELEKAVETLVCGPCSHNFSSSPKFPLVFLFKRARVFYEQIINEAQPS